MTVDAQLMSPIDPVCPGNPIILTCQQSGGLARWMITLPSVTLENTARSSHSNGSIVTFTADPGFNFKIYIASIDSDSITTELQVTAVRRLNGVTVACAGHNTTYTGIIRIASVGEFIIILL